MFLLDARDRIAAERETCRRLAFRCKPHDRLRKPSWIAGLLMIHGRGEGTHPSDGVCIVVDPQGSAAQRLGTEKIRPEEPRLDDGGMDAEWSKLDGKRFADALHRELRRAIDAPSRVRGVAA